MHMSVVKIAMFHRQQIDIDIILYVYTHTHAYDALLFVRLFFYIKGGAAHLLSLFILVGLNEAYS